MTTPERVDAVLRLLSTLNGGLPPAASELEGAGPDDVMAAESIYAAGLEAGVRLRSTRVAALSFLVEHAPAATTIAGAIAALSDAELDALEAIFDASGDVQ